MRAVLYADAPAGAPQPPVVLHEAVYPPLAEVLAATGEAAISYTGASDAPFWRDGGSRGGRNWMGRLLELVRSELASESRMS